MANTKYVYAVGRRKTAIAQVKLFAGTGESKINGLPFNAYVKRPDLFAVLLSPLKVTGLQDKFYFDVKVEGSGESAQAQAIRHGLARALTASDASLKKTLKGSGLITRDSRVVERKKPGLHKARKASQWSKR